MEKPLVQQSGAEQERAIIISSPAHFSWFVSATFVVCPTILFSLAALFGMLEPLPMGKLVLLTSTIHIYNILHIIRGIVLLPKRFELTSTGTLVVHTVFPILYTTIRFPHVHSARAYTPSLFKDMTTVLLHIQSSWELRTSQENTILVSGGSSGNYWKTILFSPQNPSEWADAVDSLSVG